MVRTLFRTAALAALPALLLAGASAQEKDKSKKTSHERLQPYWTQLDLTEKQRAEYDRVSHEYGPQIDELETKLEALKEKRHKAWLAILKPDQKEKLEHLRANRGRKKGEEEKHEDMEPTTTKTKKEVKKPFDEPESSRKRPGTKKDVPDKGDRG